MTRLAPYLAAAIFLTAGAPYAFRVPLPPFVQQVCGDFWGRVMWGGGHA